MNNKSICPHTKSLYAAATKFWRSSDFCSPFGLFTGLFSIVALGFITLSNPLHAVSYYWDSNGPTEGAGNTPDGTWGVDAYLSTGAGSTTGTSSTFATTMTEADTLIFSAGTDAVNPYTVTVSETQTSGWLTFNNGTPTLTGGTIAMGASKTITAGTTLNGTATIESAMTINTTAGGTTTFNLTANDGAAATDLALKGGISATTPANVYQIRLGGAGNGRIEGAISNHGGSLAGGWSGTWTIAGNQNLGSTIVSLTSANNKLVMGDSTSDLQSWGTTNVTTPSSVLTVKSTATVGGLVLRGGGGTLDVTGVLNSTGFMFGNASNEFGVLKLSGGSATVTGAGSGMAILGTGNKIIGGAATYGTLTLAPISPVTLGSGVTLGGAGEFENNFNFVKSGAGLVTLSASNTFNGYTKIDAGILSVEHALALQNSAIDTSGAGTMTVTVAAPTFGGLEGSKQLDTVITSGYSSLSDLTLNTTSSVSKSYTGVISDGATGMTLTKTGAGTQSLSGNNTYTGATFVNAGTLIVNGTHSNAGAYTVASGGTLGGAGTISGDTTIQSGGFLNPGNSPGVMVFTGNLTLEGSTTMELGGTTRGTEYDGLDVGGLLTYGGDLIITSYLSYDIDASSFTYDLFDIGGGFSGDFSSITLGAISMVDGGTIWTADNGNASYSFDTTTGDLNVTVIPEPKAYSTLFGVVACAMVFLRRRNL